MSQNTASQANLFGQITDLCKILGHVADLCRFLRNLQIYVRNYQIYAENNKSIHSNQKERVKLSNLCIILKEFTNIWYNYQTHEKNNRSMCRLWLYFFDHEMFAFVILARYGSDFDMGPLVTRYFADKYKILEYIVSSTKNRPVHILECLDVQQHCITKFFRNSFTMQRKSSYLTTWPQA